MWLSVTLRTLSCMRTISFVIPSSALRLWAAQACQKWRMQNDRLEGKVSTP